MAVTVDSVIVELDAKVDRYNADINRAHDNFAGKMTKIEAAGFKMGSGLRTAFAAAGTAAAGFAAVLTVDALVNVAKAGLDYAGSLGEVAQSLGIGTKFLQEFRFAATQNGASVEGADAALGKFSITVGKAFEGGKVAVGAFDRLGISVKQLSAASDSERFQLVADAIAKIKDPAQQSALAVSIFGKGAREIIPTLQAGAAAFRAQAEEARRYGLVLSDSQIQNADKTADKIDALTRALQARIAGAVADNAEAIGTLANALANLAGQAVNAASKYLAFRKISQLGGTDGKAVGQELLSTRDGRRALFKRGADAINNEGISNPFTGADNSGYGEGALREQNVKLGRRMQAATLKAELAARRTEAADVARPKVPSLADIRPVSGGGGKSPAEPKEPKGPKGPAGPTAAEIAAKAAEVTQRFNDQLARAQIDVVQALEGMAVEAVKQAQYQREIREAQRKADVASINGTKEYSDARKGTLVAEVNARAAIDFDRINREENTKLAQETLNIAQATLGNEVDLLQLQSGSARTAKERRAVELRILALNYQRERAELEAVVASQTATEAEKKIAADKLATLSRRQSLETKNVENRNQSPGAKYLDDLNKSADEVNDHIQSIAVNGLQSLNDGITDAIINGKSLSDVFSSIANSIIADLIRIAVQQAIIKPLANALFGGGESGGGGGFLSSIASVAGLFGGRRASGGNVSAGRMYHVNETGIEGFQPAQSGKIIPLGGMPNAATGGGTTIIQPLNFNFDGAVLTADLLAQMQGMATQAGRAGALAGADLAGARAAMRAGRQL